MALFHDIEVEEFFIFQAVIRDAFFFRKNDELRKDGFDVVCYLVHALGEDFAIFIPSIHKLLVKHRLRVLHFLYPGLHYILGDFYLIVI